MVCWLRRLMLLILGQTWLVRLVQQRLSFTVGVIIHLQTHLGGMVQKQLRQRFVGQRPIAAANRLNNSPKTIHFSNCRISNEENEGNESNEVAKRDDDLNDDLTLSPNPTAGELRFQIGLSSKTDISVSLSDLAGRVLQTKIYKNREGSLDERLDLGDLVSGSYIFVLQTEGKRFSRKVIVIR
jgi:hypothetical protein